MNLKSYVLVSLQILSVFAIVAMISPGGLPSITPVFAGEPAGDSVMTLSCVGLIPITLDCVSDKLQPFETLVYDANLNGIYDSGELVIVGPAPSVGTALTDDPKIRYRDNNNNNIWTSGTPEPIFYDQDGNLLTTGDRVFLLGAPSVLVSKDDPGIKFADANGDGVLNGVVRVTARLERLGGTNTDFTQEDVDAIQTVYTYDSSVLGVMRVSYGSPLGPVLPNSGQYKSAVRIHCQQSGVAGGTPLDTINADTAGTINSSSLCTEGPPRTDDSGLGCDPATSIGVCPGADLDPNVPDTPLQDLNVVNVQFMVLAHGTFSITHVIDAPGRPGSKIGDIDSASTTATPIPLQLVDGFFDNRKPVTAVHDAAVIGLAVKESAGPKPYQINVDVQNQGNVPQDISLRGIIDPPDLNGVGPFQFQLGIIDPGVIVRVPVAFTPAFGITYTIQVDVFFKDAKVDSDPADNARTTQFFLPSPKVAPTAVLTGPTKANIKEKVIFDGSASHDNNNPPQSLTYSWMADGAVVSGATMSTLSYTFFTTGGHSVSLMVCNTSMLCDSASHTIQINAVKRDPTAIILGPDKEFVKTKVTFDGSASRDNSNPVQDIIYEWTINPLTGWTINPQPVPSILSVTFFTPGVYDVTLTVCNQSGLCGSTDHLITINAIKADPTAVINGPDKAFVKEKVGFDSFGSRDNSNPTQSLTYEWTVTGPGPVNVNTQPGEPVFSATFFTPGVYTIRLTVCNTSTLCGTASHNITINAIKVAPSVTVFGPSKAFVKEKVIFDSTSFDNSNPRQNIVSMTWTIGGMVVGSGPVLSYTFFVPGTYTVTLTVCNESMLCGSGSTDILINAVKVAPTAVISCQFTPTGVCPDKVNVKTIVTFDGSGSFDNSNPRQQIISYAWTATDAAGTPVGSGNQAKFGFVSFVPGVFTITLTVCNESTLCDSASHVITYNAIKDFPTAVITGPDKAFIKADVTFDASASRDNSNPLQDLIYSWSVDGDLPVVGGPMFTTAFFTTGPHTVTVTVCNESMMCDTTSHTIQINPIKRDPTAVVTGPDKAFIKAKVVFDGSGSHDNSNPTQSLTYSWMVDGAVLPGATMSTLSYTFFTTGPHTVTLTVCNTSTLCGTASHAIQINPVKNPPTASLTGPDKVFIGEKAIYDGSGSRDNSNPVQDLTYSWTVDAVARPETTSSISVTFTSTGLHTVSLTVCNESMMCDTTSMTVTANPVKRDPTAVINAPDKEFVDTKVVYDGSKSFDNSGPVQSIISYEWTDATGAPLGSGPILSQTYSSPGMYTVVLTVCNESMFCNSAMHVITINANKVNPTAVINGPDKAFVKEKVGFDAFGSHDNSRPLQGLTYSWTAVGPGPVDVNTQPGEPVFSATFFTPGIYTITLTVCNESSLCDDATHNITINPIKRDPTAVLSCQDATGKVDCPTKVDVKTKITFDGGQSFDNSNPRQRIATYDFTVSTGGTIVGGQSSASPAFSFTPLDTGTYTVCLVVFNESGLRSTADCVNFDVNAVKANPTAVINGPAKVTEGSTVVYDGKKSFDNSNPQQGIFSYAWEFNGAPAGNGGQVTVTFGPAGDYTLTLTVCNDSGLCDSETRTIRANPPKLPVVITGFSVCTVIGDPICNTPPLKATGQRDIFVTETQNFTATWTGGTGPFTCTFTFGDSSSATVTTSGQSCTASHVYTTTGTKTVSVRVVGQNPGDDQSTSITVQLNPEPRYFHGKLSWKHHLVSPATQSFSGKATNPSTKTVMVRIDLVVDMPNGMQDFCKDEATPDNCSPRSFTLGPGGSSTSMVFTYTPGDGLGKYCFDATLVYGFDQNMNGLLEQTEVLGTDNIKSGCFNYV